ncbi:hypothetical protein EHQ24_04510 [Leptospira noumeaensis]|uniref:Uncharacterized protein n=1 Tax=Leptospira noumeaensis TaxID=2484964 RepID=A0A4R9IGZ0_9LEPT|nr:hypothetical protein [Leptospira noumeaensis]TGK86867.1 hypothetical protein EHQ24_04510 [Leptospira noumeaensis]
MRSIEELYELDSSVLIWKAILYEESGLIENAIPVLMKAQSAANNRNETEVFYIAKMHQLYFSLFLNSKYEYISSFKESIRQIQKYEIINRGEAIIESLESGCLNSDLWTNIKRKHISVGSYKYDVKPTFYLFRIHAHQSILKKCDSQASFFHASIKKELSEYPGNRYLTVLNDILDIDKSYREKLNQIEALNSYQKILNGIQGSGYRPWIEFAIEYRMILICELNQNHLCNQKSMKNEIKNDYLIGSEMSLYREILNNSLKE